MRIVAYIIISILLIFIGINSFNIGDLKLAFFLFSTSVVLFSYSIYQYKQNKAKNK